MLAIERRGFAANLGAGRKAPCRVATTGNITLVGEQTIDGVAVVADDRVLVKNQTNTVQNAVYACKTGDWELASDFNQRGDVVKGSLVFITDGTENSATDWYVSTSGRPWPGRETISFTQYIPRDTATGYAATVGDQSYSLTAGDSSASVKTANTAAIQAAIDYAYANALQTIDVSAGVFYCDPGIYLDPPGNLRTDLTTPTIFAFSLHLKGSGGLFNSEGHGTQLRFTDNSTNAVIVGSGRGMRVSDLSIIGPSGATSRAALSANGIGIALSGYLSRCLLDNVGVINFRKAYVTGFNTNVLCDSVTLFKCVAFDCHTGVHVKQTQNYIVNLFSCDFGGNNIHVLSDVGKAVNVYGGNYSTSDGKRTAFTIGTISGLTSFTDSTQIGDSPFTNYSFTAVVSSPDQPLADSAYDAFVVDTTEFGPIPMRLVSYNSSTSTITLSMYAWWLLGSGFQYSSGSFTTRLAAALAAETTLYACETITVFKGLCFNVDGVHVENPGSHTCLFHMFSGFGGDHSNKFSHVTFNYDLDQHDYHGGTAANEAVFLATQVFPFINMQSYGAHDNAIVELYNVHTGHTTDRVMVDSLGRNKHRFIVAHSDFRTNLRTLNFTGGLGTSIENEAAHRGYGEWDETPFFASADDTIEATQGTKYYARRHIPGIPFTGYYPAEHAELAIRATELALVNGTLGSVGTYPVIMGRRPYRINYYDAFDTVSGANASRWAESDHLFWSYGQNLTIDWSYVGGSNVVQLSSTTRMFAGLMIILDNGGGDERYLVTGVYDTLGFITVMRHRPGTSLTDLAGTSGTTYTGSTVKQDTYSFSYDGTLPASKFTTNTTSGATTAASGDLTGADFVNIKLTSIGSTNYTTRTAAQMFSDIPGCYSGYKYMLSVCNVSSGDTVLAAGSGVTVKSTGNIPASSVRMFEVRFTSTAAVTFDGQLSTST